MPNFTPHDNGPVAILEDVNLCNHPGDAAALAEHGAQQANANACYHPGDVNACYHPGDAAALAERGARRGDVNACYHPGDDLASDLHLSLTGIDERQLAVVAR